MSLQLRPDELLVVLERLEHPYFDRYEAALRVLCDAMANSIIHAIPNLIFDDTPPMWDEMLCTPIRSTDPEASIPAPLQGLDDGGWE